MLRSPSDCLRLAACLMVLAAVGVGLGQGPGKGAGKSGPKGEPPAKEMKPPDHPKKTPLEKLKAPPGSIFVVVEDLQHALGLFPKVMVMSLDKYQELMERIAQLEGQLKKDKKTPHACKIAGKVDGDVATLEAQYVFSTEKANTTIVLGMQGGHLTREADLDGQPPNLDFGDEGFTVEVENPGRHQLTLRLEAPVLPRKAGIIGGGGDRGFDLGLPGAAVTTVALELPAAVQALRWNDQVEKRQRGGRWEFAAPAELKNLAVTWKEPMTFPGVGPIRTVEGQISVSIEESQVQVKAELTLETLRGQTAEWQLLLPPDADVEAKSAAGTALDVARADKKNIVSIRLPQPSAERLQVSVQARYPRALTRIPVGPFAAVGADYQKGNIVVKATAEGLRGRRLLYHRHGETSQRETPKTPAGADAVLASLQYWSLPGFAKGLPGKGAPGKGPRGVPLELEFKPEPSQVETRVEHVLQVRSSAQGYRIEAKTRIHGHGLHGPVDSLEVQLPRWPAAPLPGLLGVSALGFPQALPWMPLFGVTQARSGRVPLEYTCRGEDNPELGPANLLGRARIRWTASKSKDVTVELKGVYALPSTPQRGRLELPRPLGTMDRGGQVTTTVSDDNLELLIGDSQKEGDKQHALLWDAAPRFVDLSWRPYQPALPATGETDVELKDGYARVRQRIRFDLGSAGDGAGRAKPRIVRFRIPPAAQASLKVGGRPAKAKATLSVALPSESAQAVLLEYDVPLPHADDKQAGCVLELPLIWPEIATRIDSKVRVWCAAGVAPSLAEPELAGAVWKNEGTEVVPERSRLPALVLSASLANMPLRLRVRDTLPARTAEMFIERAFIQAVVDDEGHHYRARFAVRQFSGKQLDIEVPAPVPLRNPVVRISPAQGESKSFVLPTIVVADNTLRVHLDPELFPERFFLDVEYHLPPEVLDSGPSWRLQLYPPLFKAEVFLRRVTWQVHAPAGQTLLLARQDPRPELHWEFRSGLLTPEADAHAEVADWPGGPWNGLAAPRLVFSTGSLRPVRLVQVPWQAWFLLCSGAILLAGLALAFAPLPRLVFWLLLILLAAGASIAKFAWPALFPMVLYGIQPGVAVLLVVLGLHGLLQARYRRRLAFMPGFARLRPGAAVVRAGSSNRPREASTVDAPANGNIPNAERGQTSEV